MTPPETLRVLGQTFTLAVIGDEENALSQPHKLGNSNITKQAITINAKQADDQIRDTLLHEVLHTALNIVGAMPHEREQERMILALAPILLDILRSNPALVAWLTA